LLDKAGIHIACASSFRLATQFAFARRNTNLIPRFPSNPSTLHRYDIGSSTGVEAFQLITQLVPFKQNIYVNIGISGMGTVIYEGALDIDQLEKILANITIGLLLFPA
jgi:hypothetical protein